VTLFRSQLFSGKDRTAEIKKTRIRKGFTQKELADAISTDISNYSRKERGCVGISTQEWKKLASVLDVSEEEIYQENEPTLSNTFFDNSSITNQNVGVPAMVLEHLYDYITLLKEDNARLRKELGI
jgi:transcriptional regulator with XRE-family HTH domain